MLAQYNANDPWYFGYKVKSKKIKQAFYMSGGAGYVLSKEAARRLVTISIKKKKKGTYLLETFKNEDTAMAYYMEKVNVSAGDSRDFLKLNRFFPLDPESHLSNRF